MPVVLRELTKADLPVVERWFAEPGPRRWLGDESWPRRLVNLAAHSAGRFAFAAVADDAIVGLVDVERYGDARAAVALVVAPGQRRRGVGKAIVQTLRKQPALASVAEFFGGVEAGNVAGAALVCSAGFERVTEGPDDEGFTYFALRTDGRRPRDPWALPAT